MAKRILVVDDEVAVAETIARTLRRLEHEIIVANRGADALEIARQRKPDVVVLDIMMPGMNGVDVCRHMRANPDLRDIPILFLTAKSDIEDKIDGFEAGADDYVTKPFELRELQLRVKALLRRSSAGLDDSISEQIEVGDLILNCKTYELATPDRTVLLTPVEFELIFFMINHPNQVFSTDALLQQVWGYPAGTGMPDLVRVHVKNVRDKIEPDPRDPIYLKNILRRGYLISGNESS